MLLPLLPPLHLVPVQRLQLQLPRLWLTFLLPLTLCQVGRLRLQGCHLLLHAAQQLLRVPQLATQTLYFCSRRTLLNTSNHGACHGCNLGCFDLLPQQLRRCLHTPDAGGEAGRSYTFQARKPVQHPVTVPLCRCKRCSQLGAPFPLPTAAAVAALPRRAAPAAVEDLLRPGAALAPRPPAAEPPAAPTAPAACAPQPLLLQLRLQPLRLSRLLLRPHLQPLPSRRLLLLAAWGVHLRQLLDLLLLRSLLCLLRLLRLRLTRPRLLCLLRTLFLRLTRPRLPC